MSFLELVVFVLEIIGTVVFSISGGLVGIERGLDYFGIPVLSMTTAVGGGMLRDIMVRRTPLVLRREIYAVAAIPGALIYYYLQNLLPKTLCMLMCAALIVAIRLISLRFRWNLPNSIEGK